MPETGFAEIAARLTTLNTELTQKTEPADAQVVKETGVGNIAVNQVSVTTTAGGTTIAAARSTRRGILVINHGTTAVYLGPSGVTTSNGLLLAGIVGAFISIPTTVAILGIVGSGTQTVSYIEVYD